MSGISDRGTNCQTRFRKYNRGFISEVCGRTDRGCTRQKGTVRAVQVCGHETGVGQIRADEGVVPDSRQSRGRGAGVGRSRADEGVVPDSRQSRGRGADVGHPLLNATLLKGPITDRILV